MSQPIASLPVSTIFHQNRFLQEKYPSYNLRHLASAQCFLPLLHLLSGESVHGDYMIMLMCAGSLYREVYGEIHEEQ